MKLAGHNVTLGNESAQGDRENQEDYFAIFPEGEESSLDGVLLVLADGMGGHEGGDAASVIAINAFGDFWQGAALRDKRANPIGLLQRGVQIAHQAVATARGGTEMGTTLVAVYIAPEALHWISVGDSYVLRIRDGRATRLNEDHNLGRELDRATLAGLITPQEAASRERERTHLTSFLGGDPPEFIDCSQPLAWTEGETYLLCSDGLTDALTLNEIGRVATEHHGGEEICEVLVQEALARKRPHQDNLSVVTVSVGDATPAVAAAAKPKIAPWVLPTIVAVGAITLGLGYLIGRMTGGTSDKPTAGGPCPLQTEPVMDAAVRSKAIFDASPPPADMRPRVRARKRPHWMRRRRKIKKRLPPPRRRSLKPPMRVRPMSRRTRARPRVTPKHPGTHPRAAPMRPRPQPRRSAKSSRPRPPKTR